MTKGWENPLVFDDYLKQTLISVDLCIEGQLLPFVFILSVMKLAKYNLKLFVQIHQ